MSHPADQGGFSRREFTMLSASALAAQFLGGCASGEKAPPPPAPKPDRVRPLGGGFKEGLNILFLFTDQERHFNKWPTGLSLPAHERLAKTGTTFTNHYTSAIMCSPSRSVLMTGLQTADNGVFDNLDVPWQASLSDKVPTIGHMLRKAGYYTAYKGKWHLTKEFEAEEETKLFSKEMEVYGFSDFTSPGDQIAHALGGYQFDQLISSSAATWLRRKGRPMTDAGKPWSLFVSFINPHDIMYFNTDAPGEAVQDNGHLMMHGASTPAHELYKATWDLPVAKSLRESLDTPGRPKAHGEFLKVWDHVLGHIPLEDARWRRFNDFYVNSIRSVDAQIALLLAELDALGLTERTVIVCTADHGEMGGAHGLRGKGPMAYEEAIHIPLSIVHPDVKGGEQCKALTSNIDLVPTLLGFAGAAARKGELAGRDLPGKDIGPALSNPRDAGVNAVRDAALFTYSTLSTNDSGIFKAAGDAKASGKGSTREAMKDFKPDLKKRGSVRTAIDGRYKFSRYHAPVERNSPKTLDDLYKSNDVELFDLQSDPEEMVNLASDREKNKDLILAMSAKLEAEIKAEIKADDGREMPDLPNVTWYIDKADL